MLTTLFVMLHGIDFSCNNVALKIVPCNNSLKLPSCKSFHIYLNKKITFIKKLDWNIIWSTTAAQTERYIRSIHDTDLHLSAGQLLRVLFGVVFSLKTDHDERKQNIYKCLIGT